jgi:alkylation response protein AidB-like acyl-CoA dehydrogenase
VSEQETAEEFRTRARAWVEKSLPPLEGHAGAGPVVDYDEELLQVARSRELQKKIFDGGFAGIRYPKEYGGLGLTREYQVAWHEATAGYRVPTAFSVTHGIIGPTLVEFGSEEQKAAHIPHMLDGSELWVQFLSEPSGGSDLAGLLTRADRDGDVFRLNGSKIWSTGAHFCDYAMVLARTNMDVPKHAGLSMFMMPVRSKGVTIQLIKLVTGGSHFNGANECLEFFDEVQLSPEQLIGPENDGWRITSKLLNYERNMLGGNSLNDHVVVGGEGESDSIGELVALAKAVGRNNDSYTRQLIAEAVILQTLPEPLITRVNTGVRTGRMPEAAVSILRLMAGLQGLRLKEIGLEIAGTQGIIRGGNDSIGEFGRQFLGARVGTLAGGSTEMSRNLVSERVLGLPRETSPDRGVAFNEVLAMRRQRG